MADQALIVLVCVSVPIVRAFAIDIEDCISLDRLPSVAALRPRACPFCRESAKRPGGSLGMVDHGTYTRQVRGLPGAPEIVIHVRRFRCRSCQRTTAVPPAELLPWRWYAGSAILLAVVGSLLLGRSASELCARIASGTTSEGWKSLERWQRDLLVRLWQWRAREIGFDAAHAVWDLVCLATSAGAEHGFGPRKRSLSATLLTQAGSRSTSRLGSRTMRNGSLGLLCRFRGRCRTWLPRLLPHRDRRRGHR